MTRIAIDSHRSLFYMLFTLFEILLWSSAIGLWWTDPRGLSGFYDAAGIVFLFSLVALSIICWLLRRAAPRLARFGLITIVGGLIAGTFLPVIT
jgi:hypothetical protein